MELLVLGFILIFVGAASIRYVELCQALKEEDQLAWNSLGDPIGYSLADRGITFGVFSWLINRGFDHTDSPKVKDLAKKAFIRARFSKYTLLGGVISVSVGFPLSLLAV